MNQKNPADESKRKFSMIKINMKEGGKLNALYQASTYKKQIFFYKV